jgi:TPR repeat protein
MGGSASKQTESQGASLETIIGKTQLSGEGLPHSHQDAVRFFELAAELNDPHGMCELADCLMNGWGIQQNQRRAYLLYTRASEEPLCWPPAMHCVALCHRHGIGLNDIKEEITAEDHFMSLLTGENDKTDEVSKFLSSIDKHDGDDNQQPPEQQQQQQQHQEWQEASEEEAFNWFRKAATTNKELTSLASMYEVGMCYLYGIGCSPFPKRGISWLNKAAVLDHEDSQNALKIYYTSIDLDPDAIDILSLAAKKNESWAENNLGVIAAREAMKSKEHDDDDDDDGGGDGDDDDNKEKIQKKPSALYLPKEKKAIVVGVSKEQALSRLNAKNYFLAAIQSSNGTMPEALLNLGIMYVRGWCPNHSIYEGMTLIHKSACFGLCDAVSALATCYQKGHGMPINNHIATRLFREAALLGSTEAQSQIAISYHYGRGGMIENPSEAVKWYKMASKRGRPESQAQLGILLIHGLPDEIPIVHRDPEEGYYWLKKAAKSGSKEACYALSEYYEFGVENITFIINSTSRRRRTNTIPKIESNSSSSSDSSDEDEKKEDGTVPLIARRDSVAAAARLAGWKEADLAEELEEERIKKEEMEKMKNMKEAIMKKNVPPPPPPPPTLSPTAMTSTAMTTTASPLNDTKMAIEVNLKKSQYYRLRGYKISQAVKKGKILKLHDGYSFAIASPLAPETIMEGEKRKKKEQKKRRGEIGRRRKMSKYVINHAPLSIQHKKGSEKLKRQDSIITPRIGNTNGSSSGKRRKSNNKGKARHLPIPPLPMPVTVGPQTPGWTNDHNLWQGPQGKSSSFN